MAQWLRVIATKPEDPVQFTGPTHKVKKKNQLSEVILTATPLPCHMCMCMCVCTQFHKLFKRVSRGNKMAQQVKPGDLKPVPRNQVKVEAALSPPHMCHN